jgi:methyl-accepting chemotaxis protein
MSNWKIGVRISAAFAVVILICAAMSYFNYNRVKHIDSEVVQVSGNTVPSVASLGGFQVRSYRNLELLREHAASTDPAEMAQIESQIKANSAANAKALQDYEALPFAAGEKELYEKVKQNRAAYIDIRADIEKVNRSANLKSNAIAEQMINTQLVPALNNYIDSVQAVIDLNNNGSKSGLRLVRDAVSATIQGTIIGLLLAIALAVVITLLIVRSITVPLAKTVVALEQVADGDLTVVVDVDTQDELGIMAKALNRAVQRLNSTLQQVAENASNASSSSQQLAAASEAIASGAQEQAASLEETSASLEEITATVRQSADNAQQASQLASGSKDTALQGQEVVSKAITAMVEINTASSKISEIISTIDEIAFQTNLLAVNAAVEAARAGDEGRGFAVVASEVRSLAQRSAVAAKEIKVLIQDTLRKVEAGSALVNRSGETLQGIVGSVKRVTDIVGEIAAASGEQSTGIEQVNTAMTQMDQVTQSNSAQTEELSATAQSLSEQASQLMELVGTFTLTQNGSGQRSRHEFQPLSQNHGNSLQQSNQVQHLNSGALQPARATRNIVAARSDQHPRTGKGIKARKPALAVAVASGPAVSDASFEEF